METKPRSDLRSSSQLRLIDGFTGSCEALKTKTKASTSLSRNGPDGSSIRPPPPAHAAVQRQREEHHWTARATHPARDRGEPRQPSFRALVLLPRASVPNGMTQKFQTAVTPTRADSAQKEVSVGGWRTNTRNSDAYFPHPPQLIISCFFHFCVITSLKSV